MQIEIQAHGFPLTASLYGHIEQRLLRSLSHIRDDIRKVAVRISDDNGSRHGNDKRCLIRVAVRGHEDVVVNDIRGDMYTAITHAAVRAAHSVRKLIRQRRSRRAPSEADVTNEPFV